MPLVNIQTLIYDKNKTLLKAFYFLGNQLKQAYF